MAKEPLLEELLKRAKPGGPGLTMRELVGATGRTEKTIRDKLHRLAEAGKLVVSKKVIIDLTGRSVPSPAYSILSS